MDKIWEYRKWMKLSKLKSIFNIEDNYLEAATGGVLFGDTF